MKDLNFSSHRYILVVLKEGKNSHKTNKKTMRKMGRWRILFFLLYLVKNVSFFRKMFDFLQYDRENT